MKSGSITPSWNGFNSGGDEGDGRWELRGGNGKMIGWELVNDGSAYGKRSTALRSRFGFVRSRKRARRTPLAIRDHGGGYPMMTAELTAHRYALLMLEKRITMPDVQSRIEDEMERKWRLGFIGKRW